MNELIEIIEVCPYCMEENIAKVKKDTKSIHCMNCGKKIWLCDECGYNNSINKSCRFCNPEDPEAYCYKKEE